MRSLKLGALGAAILFGICAAPAEKLPPRDGFLFWTPAQQAIGYRNVEKIFPTRTVARGLTTSVLPHDAKSIDVSYTVDGKTYDTAAYMKATNVSGLIVIQHGHILLERYGLGRTEKDRWTSFSIGKSVTSTLIGAAIKDGTIKSLDSQVVTYLPELKGTAYDGVTIGDLITMRSGVKWNEDYTDPKSDVAQFSLGHKRADGIDPIEAYMGRLPRAHKPGTVFHYNTGETDLAGVLVARPTKK